MSKITGSKQLDHKDCSLQYLGMDHSFGVAKKAYFCMTHNLAFMKKISIKHPAAPESSVGGKK